MSDFQTQTTAQQNALLAQLQSTSLENAMQRQLTAGQGIQAEAGGESQFLNKLLAGGGLASPSIFGKTQTGGLGGLLGGIGSMLGGAGQLGGLGAMAMAGMI